MQPALANNFFTPFIKQRIAMLQKEASATWNAYKYALILPVIVVFIYSFNVVEEVEFIDVPVEEENQNQDQDENQSQKQNQSQNTSNELVLNEDTVVSEENSIALKNAPTVDEDYGIYEITSFTRDTDLIKYGEAISFRRSYNIMFNNTITKSGQLKQFEVWTKFDHNKPFEHNMTVEMDESSMYFVKDLEDLVQINNDGANETFKLTKKGVVLETQDLTYGNSPSNQWKVQSSNPTSSEYLKGVSFNNGPVIFKILKTSTDESLKDFKRQMKTTHNVDIKWRGLKRKDGIITAIKFQLNDNKGTKLSKSLKNIEGIDSFCVSGYLNGDEMLWSLGKCKPIYTLDKSSVQYYGSNKPDTINTMVSYPLRSMTPKAKNIFRMGSGAIDTMKNSKLYTTESKLDSLMNQLDNSYQEIRNLREQLNISNTEDISVSTHQLGNVYYFNTTNSEPLLVINGEISELSIRDIDVTENIESMNALQGKEATALYGEKGKNGVVVLVTKPGIDLESLTSPLYNKRHEIIKERLAQQRDQIKQRDSLLSKRNGVVFQRLGQAPTKEEWEQGQARLKKLKSEGLTINEFNRSTIVKAIGSKEKGFLYYDNGTYYFTNTDGVLKVYDRYGKTIDIDDPNALKNLDSMKPEELIKERRKSILEQREAIKEQRIAEIDSIRKQRRTQLEERIKTSNKSIDDADQEKIGDSNRYKIKEFTRKAIVNAIQDDTSGYLYYDNSTYYFVVDENKKLNVFNRWGIYIDLDDPDAIIKINGKLGEKLSTESQDINHIFFYNSTRNNKPYVIANGEKMIFEKDQIRRNDTLFIHEGDNKFLLKVAGQPSQRFYGYDPALRENAIIKQSNRAIKKLSKYTDSLLNSDMKVSLSTTVKETNESIFATNDMSIEGFEKLKAQLEKAGHAFELITHKMRSGKLKSLKFKINSSTSSMDANKGIKFVQILFNANDDTPMVTMESN